MIATLALLLSAPALAQPVFHYEPSIDGVAGTVDASPTAGAGMNNRVAFGGGRIRPELTSGLALFASPDGGVGSASLHALGARFVLTEAVHTSLGAGFATYSFDQIYTLQPLADASVSVALTEASPLALRLGGSWAVAVGGDPQQLAATVGLSWRFSGPEEEPMVPEDFPADLDELPD